ncbi:hypothetical protein EDB84DRAFT_1565804 [Lactarius hengduanensis]|nr:hypothetical protein EDB84DRAFT_1565804 [Lactarius hengduanensis]
MTNNLWDWDSRASIPTVPCLPYPPPSPAKSRQKVRGGGKFTVPRSHTSIPAGKNHDPEVRTPRSLLVSLLSLTLLSTWTARRVLHVCHLGPPSSAWPGYLAEAHRFLPDSTSRLALLAFINIPVLLKIRCYLRAAPFDGSTRVARVFFGSPFVCRAHRFLPDSTLCLALFAFIDIPVVIMLNVLRIHQHPSLRRVSLSSRSSTSQ